MKNTRRRILYAPKCFTYLVSFVMSLIGLALLAVVLQFDFGTDFFEIDSCLDRDGAWHYVANVCYYTHEEQARLEKLYGSDNPN